MIHRCKDVVRIWQVLAKTAKMFIRRSIRATEFLRNRQTSDKSLQHNRKAFFKLQLKIGASLVPTWEQLLNIEKITFKPIPAKQFVLNNSDQLSKIKIEKKR